MQDDYPPSVSSSRIKVDAPLRVGGGAGADRTPLSAGADLDEVALCARCDHGAGHKFEQMLGLSVQYSMSFDPS